MQFTRKKRTKNRIIILSVLAAVIAALTVTVVLLSGKTVPETAVETKKPIQLLEGEGRYLSSALAYPSIPEADIKSIEIKNEIGHYVIARPNGVGSFRFVYFDENGEEHIYYPDILIEEPEGVIYDDLYAKVTGDGYDMIPMMSYLINVLGYPYFADRIYLSDDPATRNEQLATYGLSADGDTKAAKNVIKFNYGDADENGKYSSHKVEIGSTTITGAGYYYRVDDRDYIYVTNEYNYFGFALAGLEEFINPILIAAGLDNNQHALYAPYLTPSYRQWINVVHEGKDPFPTDKKQLESISKIIANVDVYMPAYTREDAESITDSYEYEKLGEHSFDVLEYKDNALYGYFLSALAGQNQSDVGFKQSFLYEKEAFIGAKHVYKILAVEGVITEFGDRETGEVGDARYVKVLYELLVDGKQKNIVYNTVTDADGKSVIKEVYKPYHGILDLQTLSEAGVDVSEIRELTIEPNKESATEEDSKREPIAELTVDYTERTDEKPGFEVIYATYYVDEILLMYEDVYDGEGNVTSRKYLTSPTENATVIYRFHYTLDGVAQTAQTGMISMKVEEDEEDRDKKNKIRDAIRSIVKNNVVNGKVAYNEKICNDAMSDYFTYTFSGVRAYVSSELMVGFGFVNASQRDPFYGESFYENHEDVSMLYAINQSSCETIVKHLGGIAETSQAEGLTGMKTVAVGITHDKLVKYGCYAKTIEFKLPRDMYVSNETADDELDDMAWLSTLDFVLHISDPVNDPTSGKKVRYVASEMYDIIVMIEASQLGFVDLDVVDFWARRNLILVNTELIDRIEFEFNMSDLEGKYTFDVEHNTIYIDQLTGQAYFDVSKIPEGTSYSPYDWIDVFVTQHGEATVKTAFEEYLKSNGRWEKERSGYLSDLYNYVAGQPVSSTRDTLATAMYKNFMLMLFYTRYTGTLTKEEQAAVLDPNGDGSTDDAPLPLLKFSIKLNNSKPNADTTKEYHYEFYRCDDRRVMVRIYETRGGKVIDDNYASDFYVSILGFRKIVSGFLTLLNGKTVNEENPYPDFMISQN